MGEGFSVKGKMTVSNSAMAVGDGATAANQVSAAPVSLDEAELRAELARLAERLQVVAGELADGELVAEAASVVSTELARPATRWQRILDALHRAGPGVSALTQLATDMASLGAAVEALVPH